MIVKEATHSLSDIIDLFIPEDSLPVPLDVFFPYMNILHSDGIKVVVNAYRNSQVERIIDGMTPETMLRLVLESNNFKLDDDHYVKISGTSMRANESPSYDDIYMGILETEFLDSCFVKPHFDGTFMDDPFLISCHGQE